MNYSNELNRFCVNCKTAEKHHVHREEHNVRPFFKCNKCGKRQPEGLFEKAETVKPKNSRKFCFSCFDKNAKPKTGNPKLFDVHHQASSTTNKVNNQEHNPTTYYQCTQCNNNHTDYYQILFNVNSIWFFYENDIKKTKEKQQQEWRASATVK